MKTTILGVPRAGLLLALCLGTSCAQPQRVVRFGLTPSSEAPVDRVARALAAEGLRPAQVDRETGIVETGWQDTGFLYGSVENQPATVVRRYVAVVSKEAPSVTLRMDAKKCVQGGFSIGDVDIRGACEALDGVVPQHQQELDALGARLRSALGGTEVRTP